MDSITTKTGFSVPAHNVSNFGSLNRSDHQRPNLRLDSISLPKAQKTSNNFAAPNS